MRLIQKEHLRLVALFIVGVIVLIPLFTYLFYFRDIRSKERLMNRNNTGVILTDRNDEEFFSFYNAKTIKQIPLSEIPKDMQRAVIASEDKEFYKHSGFSIRGIGRSFINNLREGEIESGGSTITQQLVKNALLSPRRSFIRKYQELVLAMAVDRRYSKDEILEMYLNSAYFGEGAFGVQAAAETYFGKNASELTLSEDTLLVGLLPAPSSLSPLSNPIEGARERQSIVLGEMVEEDYITEAQKEQVESVNISFNPQKSDINNIGAHFAVMVRNFLIDKYGENRIVRQGLKVKTTLDLSWQEYAEQVVKNQVAGLAGNRVTNGAAVAIDPKTGEVKALVGSKDWNDEKFGKYNIMEAERQPGSSFKPIIYAAALEKKVITPATVLEDRQITFPDGYKPKNYDNRYRGKVLARRALANSLNIPAVHVMDMLGVEEGLKMGKRLGLTTLKSPSNYGLSLVLGAAEVKPLEMVSAFGAFATYGELNEPALILEIKDKNGKRIFQNKSKPVNVLSQEVAFLISSILSDRSARAEVFGSALNISRVAAVKTGTTENYRDAWTIGYTPSLVVGAWVGNNDNSPMDQVAGSLGAAPIWRQLMERYLAGTPVEKFDPPAGVSDLYVCTANGLRADSNQKVSTSSAYLEYFLRGTEPRGRCTVKIAPTEKKEEDKKDENKPTEGKKKEEEGPTSSPTPEPTEEESSPGATIIIH